MNKILRVALATVLGGLAGYAWHRWVGCSTGACPIVANPYLSTFYGAMMGLLISLG